MRRGRLDQRRSPGGPHGPWNPEASLDVVPVEGQFPNALFNRGVVLGDGLRDYAAAVEALNNFLKVVPTGDQAASARNMVRKFSQSAALGSQPAK